MAQEITITAKLSCLNGGLNTVAQISSLRPTQATKGGISQTQTIPTTAGGTAITFTGLTAARWVLLTNKDTTNFIDIGPVTGGAILAMIRLKAGESALFPLTPSTTIRGLADTASVALEKTALET